MATSWRVARSLDQLLAQINAAHPTRSKAADGSIGDAAHAASKSEHNPDSNGVVRARDYTHDPAHGFDAHAMADALIASRDPRILYVISRGRIASSVIEPWHWRTYTGSNRHDHHAHVSVVAEPRLYDSTRPWRITNTAPPKEGFTMATPQEIEAVADRVVAKLFGADVIKAPTPSKDNPTWGFGAAVEWTLRRTIQTYGEVGQIKAALAELARTLPDDAARQVLDALAKDYEVSLDVQPKAAP